ncbi:MAG: hypothetical protein ABI557_08370, partial [Aureliella sp.]
SMLEALKSIDTDLPFTIVTEGLLLYFTNDELKQFLGNIGVLLSQGRNATWITDLVTQTNMQELFASHPGVASSVRRIFELTGRKIIASNPFQSDGCIQKYLDEFGLQFNASIALRELSSRLELTLPFIAEEAGKVVGTRKIWTITKRA